MPLFIIDCPSCTGRGIDSMLPTMVSVASAIENQLEVKKEPESPSETNLTGFYTKSNVILHLLTLNKQGEHPESPSIS